MLIPGVVRFATQNFAAASHVLLPMSHFAGFTQERPGHDLRIAKGNQQYSFCPFYRLGNRLVTCLYHGITGQPEMTFCYFLRLFKIPKGDRLSFVGALRN